MPAASILLSSSSDSSFIALECEDKLFQLIADFPECFQHVLLAALHRRRVRKALMKSYAFAQKHRAVLRRVVTERYNVIKFPYWQVIHML